MNQKYTVTGRFALNYELLYIYRDFKMTAFLICHQFTCFNQNDNNINIIIDFFYRLSKIIGWKLWVSHWFLFIIVSAARLCTETQFFIHYSSQRAACSLVDYLHQCCPLVRGRVWCKTSKAAGNTWARLRK